MKLFHAMAGAPVGGAESFFLDAVTALQETDTQQFVVTRNNNPQKIQHLQDLGIPYNTASFNKTLPWETRHILKKGYSKFQPDIAHYWLGRAASFAQPKAPHINAGWYGAYYHPKYYSHCQHHIAVTKDVADHIVRHGIPAHRVHVLHLYSEYKPAAPVDRAQFDTPTDAPLLLSLARLHPVKGLDILLRALQQIPEAYLWLAGSGPLEKELKALTTELGLDHRVRFLGWRTDREALLAAADLCVFPSRNDSFGAVMLEAWAAQIPLIATKAPGPKAYITHEQDGLLVEIDDITGLGMAIQRVLGDKDLSASLVANGLRTYQAGFTKDVFKKNALELYISFLKN